eukprot:CAMPEP_0182419294 /NCGR_PEP_ID=MMETSP1167-20130531/3704_1 /TAXON_ID=2988 /ORGANISM="Mallomonas Sp, Strain CCMP3275" /LENGTH=717 /DNA_ID=CAMNT_0024594119 /DNA_START=47 /DNA_END=2204 /DNA_ORIENTATION=-
MVTAMDENWDPAISENILQAQHEAESEAELIEADDILKNNDKAEHGDDLGEIPKLLQLGQSETDIEDMREKTSSIKARGHQLDLLLLKAESYSHFIRENQKRTTERLESEVSEKLAGAAETPSPSNGKKKRKPGSQKGSPSDKKSKRSDGSPSSSSLTTSPAKSPSPTVAYLQPSNLVGGTLMDYQLEGLKWLLSLYENGLSGILADEMGLGKTIQIIALIAQLRLLGTPGPFLIAGPLATLPNWMNEFKKWLPSLNTVLYHGSKSERENIRNHSMKVADQKSLDFPVVVTSFEICMIDRFHLAKYHWQYIILDEGHRIKNRNCKLVRELKQIPSVTRLLLTGTPVQNTLEELWSLLNFVNPHIFDDLAVFQSWFGFKDIGRSTQVEEIIDTEQHERVVSKLHEILRPFLLRRLKRDVLINMPPKIEIIIYCGLTSLQTEYYYRLLENTLKDALLEMGVEGGKDFTGNNQMMQLRKVCNHPFLFGEPRDETGEYIGEKNPKLLVTASGKFRVLDRLLRRLKSDGRKVLIFSQMTQLLDILQDYCNSKGYTHCRLDGAVKVQERQRNIDAFNSDPSLFIFLLSTRAGGLGINLTAADTVILFDSDWNPHADSQAMDRCHRVGQKKPVVVYRLVTTDSVEIEMLEKQVSKKKLERLTIHGGDYRQAGQRASGQLTMSRLKQLLEDDVKGLTNRGFLRTEKRKKKEEAEEEGRMMRKKRK